MRHVCVLFVALLVGQPCFSKAKVEFITPKLIDFGNIREGEQIQGKIQFVNQGDDKVVVSRVQPSCGCTVADLPRSEFAPGDTATISFTWNTTHFNGVVRKTINIYFKDSDIPNEMVSFQAKIYTELEVNPSYLYFQNVKVNPDTVVTQYAKFKNQSEKPIHVTLSEFQSEFFKVIPEKFTVPPGETYLVRVELTPKTAIRTNTTLIFMTDLVEKSELSLYVSASIKSNNP
jgi:hypothetical protein